MIFDMTLYKPTELEKWVCKKYRDNSIMTPADMDMDHIAAIFNSVVKPTGGRTKVYYEDGIGGMIFLNNQESEPLQRLKFYHELCHPAMHAGKQAELPHSFVELQEAQASAFQQYAAMPYYMLEQIETCHTYNEYYTLLADMFQLPRAFVIKRIEQVKRRMLQGHHDRNTHAQLTGVAYRYGYSNETLRVLDKLHQQLSKQREAFSQ